ncbi:transporter family-2 protein [Neolewinella xylanilytica]|uniref:Transporter family-2 protein n=1 Tax=Neolewinella xylanilytica TaxID=1514080 RepID=A0A2S6I1F1_9BACT|nr:DMT family transporter [Neolewinella xylanilytica]PPK84786.1 transporter family-2 protein [Neolewinella xylanilytica]
MQQALFIAGAFGAGALVSLYLTVNSLVTEKVGSPVLASLPYFLLAFTITLAVFLIRESPAGLPKLSEVPWWALLTGIGGAAAVLLSNILIEEIGPDRYFVAGVAGQVIVSVLLAHFALFGVEENAINWQKVVGVVLSIGGVLLVALGNAASAE